MLSIFVSVCREREVGMTTDGFNFAKDPLVTQNHTLLRYVACWYAITNYSISLEIEIQ